MFATIYLPNFYLQAALRHEIEPARPIALIDAEKAKPVILQLNEAAEKVGVRCGMTPSQSLARYLELVVKTRLREQERLLDQLLLQFSYTLSPEVEATAPGICTVRFTDPRNLGAKLERVREQLHDANITARGGIAPTPDTSLLAAHLAKTVLRIDDEKDFLAPLPIETLAITVGGTAAVPS